MSEQPEGFAFPLPQELLAQMQADVAHQRMHSEDFKNRWADLISAELTVDQLCTLGELLGMVSADADSTSIANYFEGTITGVLIIRKKDDASSQPVLQHAFHPMEDLDNPYCSRCGLPPANQVHHAR